MAIVISVGGTLVIVGLNATIRHASPVITGTQVIVKDAATARKIVSARYALPNNRIVPSRFIGNKSPHSSTATRIAATGIVAADWNVITVLGMGAANLTGPAFFIAMRIKIATGTYVVDANGKCFTAMAVLGAILASISARHVNTIRRGPAARIRLLGAFINVGTTVTIAVKRITAVARARETAFGVAAVLRAVVIAVRAFINIGAGDAVTRVTRLAFTGETAIVVGARCVGMAVIVPACRAFIHIRTAKAIT